MIRAAGTLLVLVCGCADDGGPRLEAATPAAATRNSMIVLTGERLCGPDADCAHAAGEILLGLSPPQVHANIVTYDEAMISLVIPSIATPGATHLIAVVDERSSNALPFEVLP